MLKQRLIVGLLLIALTAAGVAAEPPKQVNIAVIDFAAENMPQIEALTVTSFFRTGLVNANMFNVLERNSMDSILTEQGFQMSGCTSNDCAVKIGKLLNAEKIVIGSVSKLDNYYYITASVVDVESGKIICSDRVMTSKKKQLPDKAEDLALTLSEILAGKKPADRRKLDFEKMGILIYDIGPFATVPSATQIVNGPASDYYRFNIKTQDASSIVSMTPSVGFRYFIFDDLYADFGFGFPKTAQNENLNIGFSGSFNVVNNLNYSVQQDMTYLLSVNHLFCPYKKVRFPVGIGVLSTSFKMSYTEGNYAYTSVNSGNNFILLSPQNDSCVLTLPFVSAGAEWKPNSRIGIFLGADYYLSNPSTMKIEMSSPNNNWTAYSHAFYLNLFQPNLAPVTFRFTIAMYL